MKNEQQKTPFAKKSFGQNFLVDKNVIDKIIAALDLTLEDTVIEIGPGRGALTELLVERAGRVIAIELDRELIPILRDRFRDNRNLTLVEENVLESNFSGLVRNPKSKIQNPKSTKLVANLPYYISTAILQHLIDQRDSFSEMVLMFQREVVERITAKPRNSERGFLTVMVEAYLDVEKLFDVPPAAFKPEPKVWSAVARFTPKPAADFDAALFRDLVSTGFAQKRKTMLNNLRRKYGDAHSILDAAGIEPVRRAETLTLQEWINLTNVSSGCDTLNG